METIIAVHIGDTVLFASIRDVLKGIISLRGKAF